MKQLTEYKRNGYHWKIMSRIGNAAIFYCKHGFEAILIQSHNGREIMGKHCEPSEYPPSNEQWGSKGFSYPLSQLSAADLKLEQLANNNKKPA